MKDTPLWAVFSRHLTGVDHLIITPVSSYSRFALFFTHLQFLFSNSVLSCTVISFDHSWFRSEYLTRHDRALFVMPACCWQQSHVSLPSDCSLYAYRKFNKKSAKPNPHSSALGTWPLRLQMKGALVVVQAFESGVSIFHIISQPPCIVVPHVSLYCKQALLRRRIWKQSFSQTLLINIFWLLNFNDQLLLVIKAAISAKRLFPCSCLPTRSDEAIYLSVVH